MRISPAAGTGIGRSRITKGVRGRSSSIARTAVDPSPDAGRRRLFPRPDSGHISLMLKFIGIALALMPIFLFLRAIFMRSKKRQVVSEFRKQLDYAVSLILFFIGCAIVYAVAKLIYQYFY
jgi:hypothetical protein